MADLKDLDPDEALDRLYNEAVAGATEEWLAKQADVSVSMVRRWKKRVGIAEAQASASSRAGAQRDALRGLAEHYDPARHRTAEHLEFSSPAFVLRVPLDYTQYARACFTLETQASFTTEQIASATGTRPADVETALAAYRRHLGRRGKPCLACNVLLDDRFGAYCSRTCHDRALARPSFDP